LSAARAQCIALKFTRADAETAIARLAHFSKIVHKFFARVGIVYATCDFFRDCGAQFDD
jgi:hypothetical protein